MRIEILIEKTKTGFSSYAQKYAVYTTAKKIVKLKSNVVEALNLHFEDQGIVISEPDLKFTLELAEFFDFYKVINAKALSERIGINQSLLAQYIRGFKKPSTKQSKRILKEVQNVGKELANIQFLN
jgi:hypothetical protein